MAYSRQESLFCPDCGGPPTVAGLCGTCYARRRHSARYFAGARDRVLARDGDRCQGCQASRGAGNRPAVHHRRPGVHEEQWLVTLCPACHALIHKLLANKRWLPDSLLELWREQHPHAPLQLQFASDLHSGEDRRGGEAAAS